VPRDPLLTEKLTKQFPGGLVGYTAFVNSITVASVRALVGHSKMGRADPRSFEMKQAAAAAQVGSECSCDVLSCRSFSNFPAEPRVLIRDDAAW
jgi:hypothetical protein